MKGIVLALLSAILLILSFPKFDYEFLAWIALVPLFISLKDKGIKFAFLVCFLTGISFMMGIFCWINMIKGFTALDFLLLGIYFGSYFGMFGLLLNFFLKKCKAPFYLSAPVIWVSLEYIRSHAGFIGLPWALLGHSQYLNLPIIQIASITGVYGVSFLIVMINAAISEAFSHLVSRKEENTGRKSLSTFKPAIVTLSLLGLSLVYGFVVISQQPGGDKVSITVIQGNIPQDIKWHVSFRKLILSKYADLTRSAARNAHASLIVWPETAVQGAFTKDIFLLQTIASLAKEVKTYLMIGGASSSKFNPGEFKKGHRYNSAFLISPKGLVEKWYNKIRLLPFSEYLPYKDSFPWPSRYISGADTLIPGKEYAIFNLNGNRFGVLICWENIFPDLFRQFVKNGANFMVNITNEAWFDETAAPYQLAAMSVFRAVENRVSVVRSANTGISCFIDPNGKVIGRVKNNGKDIFVDGYLTIEIPLSQKKTLYTMYGDIFAYCNIGITLFMLTLSILSPGRGCKSMDSFGKSI